MTFDQALTPLKPRWQVWTDHEAHRSPPAYGHPGARWFWSASGPRGHMSGAEAEVKDAIRRAELAAMQLDRNPD